MKTSPLIAVIFTHSLLIHFPSASKLSRVAKIGNLVPRLCPCPCLTCTEVESTQRGTFSSEETLFSIP
nr:MAG TPA: hypothetical protein [Caudoviricetes sp.]